MANDTVITKCKRRCAPLFPQIEDALALWFDNAIECRISVNGPIIQEKALDFARLIVPDAHFIVSIGWLSKKHNIFEVAKSGEAASTPS